MVVKCHSLLGKEQKSLCGNSLGMGKELEEWEPYAGKMSKNLEALGYLNSRTGGLRSRRLCSHHPASSAKSEEEGIIFS